METQLRQIEAMITTIEGRLLAADCGPLESKYLLKQRDNIRSALYAAIHNAPLQDDQHRYHLLHDRLNFLKDEIRENLLAKDVPYEQKEANRLEALAIRKEMTAIWNRRQGIRG